MAVRVKRSHQSDLDRISSLPGEIIDEILLCLPLKDAVRTSIFSNKWRYIWTRLPELVFDNSLISDSMFEQDRDRRLKQIISQVLHQHNGSIRKFTLSLFELMDHDIDDILRSVCNKDMKDFNLDLIMGQSYKVGAPVFSCAQLEKLYLGFCKLRPPRGFEGFRMLTSLKLCEVLITVKAFSSFISSCPKLETLTLEMCACNRLEIVAPNLRYFDCGGFHDVVCFKDTPKLEILSVLLGKRCHQRKAAATTAEEMVLALSGLKSMDLNSNSLECMFPGTVPERFQNYLSNLEDMKLHVSFQDIDETRRVLGLLRSSPNLETISIDTSRSWSLEPASEPALEAFRSGLSDLHLHKLREVVMVFVTGKQLELLLTEFFLANAPVLEKMVIKSIIPLTVGDCFLGKMMQFQRTSPKAYIKYCPPSYMK